MVLFAKKRTSITYAQFPTIDTAVVSRLLVAIANGVMSTARSVTVIDRLAIQCDSKNCYTRKTFGKYFPNN